MAGERAGRIMIHAVAVAFGAGTGTPPRAYSVCQSSARLRPDAAEHSSIGMPYPEAQGLAGLFEPRHRSDQTTLGGFPGAGLSDS